MTTLPSRVCVWHQETGDKLCIVFVISSNKFSVDLGGLPRQIQFAESFYHSCSVVHVAVLFTSCHSVSLVI